jgi:hypothetical protein
MEGTLQIKLNEVAAALNLFGKDNVGLIISETAEFLDILGIHDESQLMDAIHKVAEVQRLRKQIE